MALKENCRNRIFDIIEKITEHSKYVLMVVDKSSYSILSMVCKNEELLERGIALIEHMNTDRIVLKDFDCIYFISSDIESVHSMLNDFKEEETRYNNVHILFTSAIAKNSHIIDTIASNNFILKRIKSCASINLNFFAYESRTFYFENNSALYDYYPLKKTELLYETANRLIAVCSCLKTLPCIRFQNSDLCRKFAEVLHTHMKNSEFLKDTNSNDLLLILDRSIDCSVLFAHEYSYQSLCYDILNINAGTNNEENQTIEPHSFLFEITNNEQKKEEKTGKLSEEDQLWKKYRHLHIQDVNEIINNEISVFTEQNAVAKLQKKENLNAAETLEALRSLPQYESMIEKYWLHVHLCNHCFKVLQKKNIVEAGMLEQDLCCNIDKYGKELSHNKNTTNLNAIITRKDYKQEEKTRLLLLYFINYVNISEHDKIKIIESAQLGLFMQKMINEFLQLKLHLNHILVDESILTSTKVHHVMEKQKDKIKNFKRIAKSAKYELSRYEPNLKDLILKIYTNSLHKGQFPYVDYNTNDKENASTRKKQNVSRGTKWEFKTTNCKTKYVEQKQKIIIFILGGITFPEIKCIYEMSEQLNLDLYIGGTSLLTSTIIFNQFKELTL